MPERVKMGEVNLKQRRITAWAGVLGPALFVGIFCLEGLLRPGYDPSRCILAPSLWDHAAGFRWLILFFWACCFWFLLMGLPQSFLARKRRVAAPSCWVFSPCCLWCPASL